MIAGLLSKIPLDWLFASIAGTVFYFWHMHLQGTKEMYKEAYRRETDKNKMLTNDKNFQHAEINRSYETGKRMSEYTKKLEEKLFGLNPHALNDPELRSHMSDSDLDTHSAQYSRTDPEKD